MTVNEILESYLKEKGFDGLVNMDNECGCTVGDLQPCDGIQRECIPGYLQHHTKPQIDAGEAGECESSEDCGCIGPRKPGEAVEVPSDLPVVK